MKKIYLVLLFSFSCFIIANSQTDSVKEYLDDGGRFEARNSVKFDLGKLTESNLMFSYEHRFSSIFSLETGVGFLCYEYYKPRIKPLTAISTIYNKLNNGYCFQIQPKFHNIIFESMYTGFLFRYNRIENQAYSIQYGAVLGRRWFLSRHFIIEAEADLGMNFEYTLDGKSYIYNSDIVSPDFVPEFRSRSAVELAVKAGYVF